MKKYRWIPLLLAATAGLQMKAFGNGTSTSFNFPADGDAARGHEYSTAIPVHVLSGLRFDPAMGSGQIDVDWIRVEDASGKTLHQWDF